MILTTAPTMAPACTEGANSTHAPNMSPTSEESSGDTSQFMMRVHQSSWRWLCQLVSGRFHWPGRSLESLVRECTTAGSRHGRLGGVSSSQYMQSCVAARPTPLTFQEEPLCHGYPLRNLSFQTATDPSSSEKVADDVMPVPTLGATLCAALAIVYFGRGQCLQETRLMSQCWLRMHRRPRASQQVL